MGSEFLSKLDWWAAFGLVAQLAFTARFIVQWIVSEREGKSVIPLAFWYFSLFGSTGLLVYAIVRADPIFILGQSLGSIIYLRNLTLIYRERRSVPPLEKPGA
ncbi:MAG TPA: lipid-A-disaccharide synthase N-terminal domain-containing protein [Phycisphaerae bacterium]|nr:lipid-A-disaccharide synthase N-terminal domain-containing protein [Phycisphaerae bacterium]